MRRLVVLLAVMLAPASAAALTPEVAATDVQIWTDLAARVTLAKKLKLTVKQLVRFDQDITRFGKAATEAQLDYEIIDNLELHFGYRITSDRRDEGDWRMENRLYAGGRTWIDVGEFEFGYRLEFQEDIYRKAGQGLNDNVLRNRVDASYEDLDPVQPFVTFEVLSDIASKLYGTRMRNWRATAGLELEVGKHEFEFFYRLRRSFDTPVDTDHIIGAGFRLELGKKKKGGKKKKKK